MKYKNMARQQGGMEIIIGSLTTIGAIESFKSGDYISGSIFALGSIPFFIDGTYDLIKGTHHYIPMRVWQKLSRSGKTKSEIERDLEEFKIKGEKEGPSLKSLLTLGYLKTDSDKFK